MEVMVSFKYFFTMWLLATESYIFVLLLSKFTGFFWKSETLLSVNWWGMYSVGNHVKMYTDLLLHMWAKTICLALSLVSRHIFWKRCNHLILSLRIHLFSGFFANYVLSFSQMTFFWNYVSISNVCFKNTCNCSFSVVSVFKWQTEGWAGYW